MASYPPAQGRLLGTPRQPAHVPARGARARGVSPGRRRRGLPRLASCPPCALPGLSPSHGGHRQKRNSIPASISQEGVPVVLKQVWKPSDHGPASIMASATSLNEPPENSATRH